MLVALDKKYPGLRKKLTKPFVKDINPNTITYFGLLFALVTGYSFYKNEILLAAVFLALSTYCDVLDGAIAKQFQKSKLGDFLDHTFDRISDSAIFIGLALNPNYNTVLVFLTLISVLLVSYLGTQAHALTKERFYGGVLGRADRLLILIICSTLVLIHPNFLIGGLYLILLLSIITIFQRYYATYKILNKEYLKAKKNRRV